MQAIIPSLRPLCRALTACLGLALATFGTARAQTNLLLNGGFESSAIGYGTTWNIDPWLQGGSESNRIIDGRATAGGLTNDGWVVYPQEGLREYRFQGGNNYYIQQTITLDAGDYSLSAWFAGRNNYSSNYLVTSTVALELRDSLGSVITPSASETPAIPQNSPDSRTGHWVNWTRKYSGLAAGTYTVRVTKGSSGVFQQGWVDDVSLTKTLGTFTNTTLITSGTPSTAGQNVTFTATIHPVSGTDVPTGSVQFKVDGLNLGDPVTVTAGTSPDGTAQISTSTLSVVGSPHAVTAEFTATGSFANSNSNSTPVSQAVDPATTTTVVSTGPSTVGTSVTFTATIHPISGELPVPTGTVQFKVDGSNLGSPVTVNPGTSPDGTAQISTDALTVAGSPHAVTAVFTSSDGVDRSTGTLTDGQTVNPAAASVLVFTTAPANAFAGSPFGTQPVVRTRDAFGNNSTVGLAASEIVTITIKTGTGTLGGTFTYDIGTAAGNGTITGSGLAIDTAGSFTLGASSLNLTEGESASFTVQAADANRLSNPSFELGNLTSWSSGNFGGGYVGVDANGTMGLTAHHGTKACRLQENTWISQSVTLGAGNYSLSMWAQSRQDSPGNVWSSNLTFQLLDSSLQVVDANGGSNSPPYLPVPMAAVNWTRNYTGLAAGTYTVKVTINPNPSGQGWVDDFSLTPISGLSTACDLTSFNWGSYYGTINNTLNTVNLVVPHFTDLTTLVPACAASIGATISPASGVQQDFSDSVANPVQYTVTAEAGVSSQKTYAVTVTNNPEILWNPSFAGNSNYWTLAGGAMYEGQYIPGSHDAIGRSIRMMDPGGTLRQTVTLATGNYRLGGWFTGGTLTFQLRDSSNNPVTPAGAVSPAPIGAPQDPAPGDWVNWTRDYGNLPAGDYTVYVQCNTGWVHADDFSMVPIGPLPYCDMVSFNYGAAVGVITPGSPNTVLLTVPFGAPSLATLIPDVTVSSMATFVPTGAQNFTNSQTTPVEYTVTAQDGTSQQTYQVTVVKAAASAACDMVSFEAAGVSGVITPGSPNTVVVTLPSGTPVSALTPTVVVSDYATFSPPGAQNFTNSVTTPVPYTVTAEDGSTQKVYQVTLVVLSTGTSYGTWETANSASGGATADSNNNGVPNGVEFFMGGTQASPATLPPLVDTAGIWTWTIPYDPAALATYKFQVSGDLSGWTDVLPGDPLIEVLTGPPALRLTLPSGMRFCRLLVTTQ